MILGGAAHCIFDSIHNISTYCIQYKRLSSDVNNSLDSQEIPQTLHKRQVHISDHIARSKTHLVPRSKQNPSQL
jgi:hypothetical protein